MAGKPVKILVACGSGIATSSVAKHEVEKACKEAGLNVEVTTTDLQSMVTQCAQYDVICTTCPYKGHIDKPTIMIFGLISNMNKKKIQNQIVEAVKACAE